MSEVTNFNEAKANETANEYAKPIVLRFKDTNQEYTLEFNRATVTLAEKRGFPLTPMNAGEVMTARPAEVIPDLFYYSFLMHHRGMNRAITDKILFEDLGGLTDEMLERLVTLHAQGYESLINTEDKPKNSNLAVEM